MLPQELTSVADFGADIASEEARNKLKQALQRLEKAVETHAKIVSRPIEENSAFKTLEAECARLSEENSTLTEENAALREEIKQAESTIRSVTDALDEVIARVEGLLSE